MTTIPFSTPHGGSQAEKRQESPEEGQSPPAGTGAEGAMSYIIRPWALEDLKAVMRLVRESASLHKALDQVKTTPEILRDEGFRKDATFGCLVAEVSPEQRSKEGDAIVAYQFHYLTYCTWDGRILFGEDLYVQPEFRGKGIGSSLLATAAKVALAKRCSQIRFISATWNQPATDFYAKLGALNVTIRNSWNLCSIEEEHIRRLAEPATE